ncbi:hypothetical protein [Streptomyces sp. NPDC046821]|uniref:hypothetical protein n=1 Tax=Streptomyces sp. NPDC046821 TaxID=3154702 RepID=UPI0033F57E7E
MSEASSAPARFTVLVKPQLADKDGHPVHGNPLRVVSVEATGASGETGYPVFEAEGVRVEIDPRTRTVEAVTVDGEELPYGWVAEVADK